MPSEPERVEDVLAEMLAAPGPNNWASENVTYCEMHLGGWIARIEAAHAREIAENAASRASLAQEIAAALKVRGLWAGNGEPSDLITAVCGALAAKDAEIDRLKELLLTMEMPEP